MKLTTPLFSASCAFLTAVTAGCASDENGAPDDATTVETGGAPNGSGGGSGGTPVATGGAPVGAGGTQLSSRGSGGEGSGGEGSGGEGSGGEGTGGEGSGGEDSGGEGAMKSNGCGTSTQQQEESWQTSSVGDRDYDVRLPAGYDPNTPYPMILLLHGCGSATNNVPMDQEAGDEAIVVRGTGSDGTCWANSGGSPDYPYIASILEDVQERFCTNPDHMFAVGYSSGSWVASGLSCFQGDVFRGIGTVTGGEPGGISDCKGQVGRIFVHDNTDNDNKIEWDTPSRDRMITTNNCSSTTMSVDPSPCVEYEGCDPGYPVVWCETSGNGHARQDNLAAPAFWNFFKRLMDE